MTKARISKVLLTSRSLNVEFARCCGEYQSLQMAVAWCGNPRRCQVFKLLNRFEGDLEITVGVSFCHTSPDAIAWFRNKSSKVHIFRGDDPLFHPKVYLFTKGDYYAVFVGSSNFTGAGFYGNIEVNTLIEGKCESNKGKDIQQLKSTLDLWKSPIYSFDPTNEWLEDYRRRYLALIATATAVKVPTPPMQEETSDSKSWLETCSWLDYFRRVLDGLRQSGRTIEKYQSVLDAAATKLPLPWSIDYFDEIENRRIMGGLRPYEWLGHVASARHLRRMMKNGTEQQKTTIISAINRASEFQHPIDWRQLKVELNRLTALGLSMKVWGRFLCLARPDLYCTVASESVRLNLSEALNKPVTKIMTPDGYINLLKIIHSSPWFLSPKPDAYLESSIWQRRVALMDTIFY